MLLPQKKTVVVIGNGMVGHRFVEKLVESDTAKMYRVVTFCEEPRAAYDRVGLTSFFAHRSAEKLMLARLDWYREHRVEIHIGDRADKIDRTRQVVHSDKGVSVAYDQVVIATGSYPFVPPINGIKLRGVFVYRTIEDLEQIIAYGKSAKRCAVIGGGLLGLEAAKAAYDLGLETHVIEFAPRLMPRQVDDKGSAICVRRIESLGVRVHLNKTTKEVRGDGHVEQIVFGDDSLLDVDMIIVSCGIRPRDDLAKACGLEVHPRGGIVVNNFLQTSDPDIYAIGEAALHSGMVYGLVAPGYAMAEIAACNLTGNGTAQFTGPDMSTKLKLMGVDVASFGQYESPPATAVPLTFEDPFGGVYKKLVFDSDGMHLLGGILVGDASDYSTLSILAKSGDKLPCAPGALIGGAGSGAAAALGGVDSMSESAQICSCNNVSKGMVCAAIRENGLRTLSDVKQSTKAGTGCGGCMPLVTDLFKAEMKKVGVLLTNHLCEHFSFSRQDLFAIVKVNQIRTFDNLIRSHGKGTGCEICKPAIASILASLWNDSITTTDHLTLQDTNDRFLANAQRGGLYSVVPRVPGGEITPDKLVVLGQVAKKYGLYTKITGAQRIDLFGTQLQQLPDIWEELVKAGFESGHAYGKAVRTVKSCVGTTWCRFGVQDSVGFAVAIEQRYRGIRAPHKLKFAVSGCIRECAEAQNKDVGLVATERGYNLYVCGNGGAKPRHADLLVGDIDEKTAVQTIDRFLMYYIFTADRLTRTSVWLEKLDGGIDHIREVVIDDKLGICDELDRRMQHLVDTYQCEWKEVVENPERRKLFRQFVNTDETEPSIEFVNERGQLRPANWPKERMPLHQIQIPVRDVDNDFTSSRRQLESQPSLFGESPASVMSNTKPPAMSIDQQSSLELNQAETVLGVASQTKSKSNANWVQVGNVSDFPKDGGAAIKYGKVQIAVFNFTSRGEWYACQNMCPHKNAFLLSRGLIGNAGDIPKVACPLHKRNFSLQSGECLSGEAFSVKVFSVKVDAERVYLDLPPQKQLDAILATEIHLIRVGDDQACAAECDLQCSASV